MIAALFRQRQPAWLLAPILLAYVCLSIVYGVSQPIWEAPDEGSHVEYIRYVQIHRALPMGQSGQRAKIAPWEPGSEFSQLPLYYVLMAGVLSPIELPPNADWHRNPYVAWPDHPLRRAVALHRTDEGWPYRGLALFVHLGRLVAISFGLVTLLATYALVATITGRRDAPLFATAWLAWTPGFLLASSRINNDAAAMAWSALTLALCTRLLVAPSSATLLHLAALSVCLAGALLSKLHMLFLVPLALVAVATIPHPGASPAVSAGRRLGTALLVMALPVGLLSAWWAVYGRSFQGRVGEAVGFGVARIWELILSLDVTRVLVSLRTLHGTWWGGIGYGAESLWPGPLYVLLAASLLSLLGASLFALRDSHWWPAKLPGTRRSMIVLFLAPTPLLYATVARHVLPWIDLDSNARFVLPAAPVLALAVTVGGRYLPLGRLRPLLATGYLLGILGLATATPLILFSQISAPTIPARLARDVDEATRPAQATFANGVELLAVDDLPSTLQPGEPIRLVLRWRIRTPPREDFTAFVHLVDRSGERVIGHDAVPYAEVFPPRFWEAGELVDEVRLLTLPKEIPPGHYTFSFGMYTWRGRELSTIPVVSVSPASTEVAVGAGRALPAILDDGKIVRLPDVYFGESLVLHGYTLREEEASRRVSLFWKARRALTQDLVVSVQLLDEHGRLVAQHDGEPVDGRLPTTTWEPSELVQDDHSIPVSPGAPHLHPIVVVYEKGTGQRLSVVVDGQVVGDHFVMDRSH